MQTTCSDEVGEHAAAVVDYLVTGDGKLAFCVADAKTLVIGAPVRAVFEHHDDPTLRNSVDPGRCP